MNKILFLINPVAGGRHGAIIKEHLVEQLDQLLAPDMHEIAFTRAGDGGSLPQDIFSYETIAVAGGDGTFARVVQELAGHDHRPRLAIIPLGTGNDLARALGIWALYKKQGLKGLLAAIVAGRTVPIDVLSVNGRLRFTNYCGIGIDAKISNDFNLLRHAPLVRAAAGFLNNRPAYGFITCRNLLYHLPFAIDLLYADAAGENHRVSIAPGARQVLVTNIPSYAAGTRPSPRCNMNDGLFEVTVSAHLGQWLSLHLTRFGSMPLLRLLPPSLQFQARSLVMSFSGDTCFQADGELYENIIRRGQPLAIECVARIEMIVP